MKTCTDSSFFILILDVLSLEFNGEYKIKLNFTILLLISTILSILNLYQVKISQMWISRVVKYQHRCFVLSDFNGRDFEVWIGLGPHVESYFLLDFAARLRFQLWLENLFDSNSPLQLRPLNLFNCDSDSKTEKNTTPSPDYN